MMSVHNSSGEDKHVELSKSLRIMSITIKCLAFVLGVVGNGIVIWVSGFRMKKTVNAVWFLNLAVADFLFSAFLLLSVAQKAMDFHWPFGLFMCKLDGTLRFLNMFASVYIMVVISMDRCISVVFPIWARNHRSVGRASLLSLGVWGFALLLSSPYFMFRKTMPQSRNVTICINNFDFSHDYKMPEKVELQLLHNHTMTITRFLLGFILPFFIIASCYAVIIHRLKRSCSMLRRSRSMFKTIAAIITTFFLCWAPYHILGLIEVAHHAQEHEHKHEHEHEHEHEHNHEHSNTLEYVFTIGIPIATSLLFLNSCLNPLLYMFTGQYKVRKSVLKVLETAFIEEVPVTNTCANSMNTSCGKEQGSKSFSETEV